MTLTTQEWHTRFLQQAGWSRPLRHYLFKRLALAPSKRLLEVGVGTGAVAAEASAKSQTWGIDLHIPSLMLARQENPALRLAGGDALHLPFSSSSFDAVFCHYFLLWVSNPAQALAEMVRVTHPGGWIMALAEPDYGARIDFPEPLADLGMWQRYSLQRQGADPLIGRKLSGLFNAAGLSEIESGVMGGQWKGVVDPNQTESEWKMLEADLGDEFPPARLQALRRLDQVSWQKGERVLFLPTFYAVGKVS
jgi:SAM-dependent methyltransferase